MPKVIANCLHQMLNLWAHNTLVNMVYFFFLFNLSSIHIVSCIFSELVQVILLGMESLKLIRKDFKLWE